MPGPTLFLHDCHEWTWGLIHISMAVYVNYYYKLIRVVYSITKLHFQSKEQKLIFCKALIMMKRLKLVASQGFCCNVLSMNSMPWINTYLSPKFLKMQNRIPTTQIPGSIGHHHTLESIFS